MSTPKKNEFEAVLKAVASKARDKMGRSENSATVQPYELPNSVNVPSGFTFSAFMTRSGKLSCTFVLTDHRAATQQQLQQLVSQLGGTLNGYDILIKRNV
jgi:hypothetical protein